MIQTVAHVMNGAHCKFQESQSGIGRDFSLEGMLESFTQRKNVTVNLNTR